MAYLKWFEAHGSKHKKIVDKLIKQNYSKKEIINYFNWDNLHKVEPEFCPLFKDNKKCHNMENLNCYLCACPNFRFDDTQKKYKSFCSVESKDGRQVEYSGIVHQDCSKCKVPHFSSYIDQHFNCDWFVPMESCCTKL